MSFKMQKVILYMIAITITIWGIFITLNAN